MHIYSPHLITDHQSETEWAWEGRETAKPHERRLRIHLSFYYCKSQSSKALSLEDLTSHFGLFSGFICAILFFKRNWTTRYLEFKVLCFSFNDFRKGKSCRALHKLFTYLLVWHILSNRLEKRDCLKSYFQFAYTCWRTTAKESRFCRERTRSPESPVSDLGQSESCNWKSGALTVSQTHTHTWTFSLTICLQCWSMPLMKYSV